MSRAWSIKLWHFSIRFRSLIHFTKMKNNGYLLAKLELLAQTPFSLGGTETHSLIIRTEDGLICNVDDAVKDLSSFGDEKINATSKQILAQVRPVCVCR